MNDRSPMDDLADALEMAGRKFGPINVDDWFEQACFATEQWDAGERDFGPFTALVRRAAVGDS